MSFDSTKPAMSDEFVTTINSCANFAVKSYIGCYERNLDLPSYKRPFMTENCGALMKRVYATCEMLAERTGGFTKPYVACTPEK